MWLFGAVAVQDREAEVMSTDAWAVVVYHTTTGDLHK